MAKSSLNPSAETPQDQPERVQEGYVPRVNKINRQNEQDEVRSMKKSRKEKMAKGKEIIARARMSKSIEERTRDLQKEKGLTEEKARQQAYSEFFNMEKEHAGNRIIAKLAAHLCKNPQDIEKMKEKLEKFFRAFAGEGGSVQDGIRAFNATVREAVKKDRDQGKMEERPEQKKLFIRVNQLMHGQGGANIILAFNTKFSKVDIQGDLHALEEANFLHMVAKEEDVRYFDRMLAAYEEEQVDTEEHYSYIHEELALQAKSESVRKLIEQRKRLEKLTAQEEASSTFSNEKEYEKWLKDTEKEIQKKMREEAREKNAERDSTENKKRETIAKKLNIESAMLSSIPTEGQDAITNIVTNKAGEVVLAALLGNDIAIDSRSITGTIGGAKVHFAFKDGALSFIGKETGEHYPLGGVQPQHYDLTRLYMLAMEDGHLSIAQKKSFITKFASITAKVDTTDTELMDEQEANRFHKYLGVLIGPNVDADEEELRLRTLGAIDSNGIPSAVRIEQLARAITFYATLQEEEMQNKRGIQYEDFVTLTIIWKKEGFKLPQLTELQKKTKTRIDTKEKFA